MENAPLQEGHVKLDDAAMTFDVAMYSMTHALQYAAPQQVHRNNAISWGLMTLPYVVM